MWWSVQAPRLILHHQQCERDRSVGPGGLKPSQWQTAQQPLWQKHSYMNRTIQWNSETEEVHGASLKTRRTRRAWHQWRDEVKWGKRKTKSSEPLPLHLLNHPYPGTAGLSRFNFSACQRSSKNSNVCIQSLKGGGSKQETKTCFLFTHAAVTEPH